MITLLMWRQLLNPDHYYQFSLDCPSSICRQSLTTSPLAVHRTHSKSSRRPPLSRSKRVKQQRLSKWWQKNIMCSLPHKSWKVLLRRAQASQTKSAWFTSQKRRCCGRLQVLLPSSQHKRICDLCIWIGGQYVNMLECGFSKTYQCM